MNRRLIKLIPVIAAWILLVLTFAPGAANAGEWVSEDDHWYYREDDRNLTGWQKINGKWYFLDSEGVMQTGWLEQTGKWYYLKGNGVMQTGWQKIDGFWYYLKGNGVMQTGWVKDNDSWYYLDPEGIMQTGWIMYKNRYYHLDAHGVMQTGWIVDNGQSYYLNANGIMLTGWQKVDGKWYYLNAEGIRQTGWLKLKGKWYYLDADGVMQTGWISYRNHRYFLNEGGVMQTGWLEQDNRWYYLDSSGIMATGTWIADRTIYSFSDEGVWLGASAAELHGWKKFGGHWFYCDGQKVRTGWLSDGGKWYYLDSEGIMQTGWVKDSGKWYYMNKSGVMQTGMIRVGSSWYYLKSGGAMATGWQQLDGKWYYFGTSGARYSGWLESNNQVYFLKRGDEKTDGYMLTGTHTIGGRTCVFAANGTLQSRSTRYQYEIYLLNRNPEIWCDTWNSEAIIYIRTNNPDPASIAIEGFSNRIYDSPESAIYRIRKSFGITASEVVQLTDYVSTVSTGVAYTGWDFYRVPGGYFAYSEMDSDVSYVNQIRIYEYLENQMTYTGASVNVSVHGTQDTAARRAAFAQELAKKYFGAKYEFSWEKLDKLLEEVNQFSHYPLALDADGNYYHIYKYFDTEWGTFHVTESISSPRMLGLILDHCKGVTYVKSSDSKGDVYHAYLDVTYKDTTREIVGFCPFAEYVSQVDSPYVNLNAY